MYVDRIDYGHLEAKTILILDEAMTMGIIFNEA